MRNKSPPDEHSDYESDDENNQKGSRKRNRSNWQQRNVLERVFQSTPYPDLATRNELAEKLGMSPRKIQVWFQNRRTKLKSQKAEGQSLDTIAKMDDVNKVDPTTGNSLLFVAAAAGFGSVTQLLSRGASPNTRNRSGMTPLYIAVFNEQEKIVDTLLAKKYNCDAGITDSIYGQTPLHIAALKGNEAISLALLSKGNGVHVNAVDFERRTPLHHAAIYGHTRLVKQLINCKAEVNAATREGITPLHCAALGGHPNVINLLLDHGANINSVDRYGYTPLVFATRQGKDEVVSLLISRKALLDVPTNMKWTALHFAASNRQYMSILKQLAESGANIEATTAEDYSAMHIAYNNQNNDALMYLNDLLYNKK